MTSLRRTVAAATFHHAGHTAVAEIGEAYRLLTPLLGITGASTLFALALLASGQNSTLTGTLAGQIVMEGFLDIRLAPWLAQLITRLIAIVPAVVVTIASGESGTARLLVLSQVVLSMQLGFAVFPLVMFTSDRRKMGEFANSGWIKTLAWAVAFLIAALNAWLLLQTVREWLGQPEGAAAMIRALGIFRLSYVLISKPRWPDLAIARPGAP